MVETDPEFAIKVKTISEEISLSSGTHHQLDNKLADLNKDFETNDSKTNDINIEFE